MVTIITSKDLPLLPGYTFDYQNTLRSPLENEKKFFYKGQFFRRNGYLFETQNALYPQNKLLYEENKAFVPYDVNLTYHGQRVSNAVTTRFVPHYVKYDSKKLNFSGYFTQVVKGSPDETYRVRLVNLLYFLEDDTICVNEAHRPDAGFKQGKLVTRTKLPKPVSNLHGPHYTWKDLNLGMDMRIYGVKYRLCSCDEFTRQFLTSQGLDLNPEEPLPQDPYEAKRLRNSDHVTSATKRVVNYDRRLRHYLQYDGVKLSFRAAPATTDGAIITNDGAIITDDDVTYDINFYLVDNTMEVLEKHRPNNGRVAYPKLVARMRVPKDYRILLRSSPGSPEDPGFDLQDSPDYYGPRDFLVGDTINVLNKPLLILDCSDYTRQYYRDRLLVTQPEKVSVEK